MLEPRQRSLGAITDMLAAGAEARVAKLREHVGKEPHSPNPGKREAPSVADDADGADDTDDETDVEDTDDDDTSGADDQHSEGDDDGSDTTSDDDSDPGDQDDDSEGDDDEADDTYDSGTYSDDDLLEVVVDGEVREVSLSDLKAAYSGEGAIEKRLKEATEARKEATTLREQALSEQEAHRTRLLQVVQQLDSVIFAPMVEKPNAALRRKDREAYDEQMDAYEEDQKRINASRGQLQQFMTAQYTEQARNREAYRQEQQQVLIRRAQLKNQKDVEALRSDVKLVADHYGFNEAQIREVDNAGVFLMARDAARYIRLQEMQKKARQSPKQGNGKATTPRKLKPGGATSKKLDAKKAAQQKQAVAVKARSGKIDDVAAMIASNARKR